MAVKLISEKSELIAENGTLKISGVVAADAKTDVTDNLVIDGVEMGLGSVAYTNTKFDWATCDSNGHWTWQ